MRRKTASQAPVHPRLSRAAQSEVGLIAKAEEGAQSAVGECVLDNRSHRTDQGSGVRGRRTRLPSAKSWTAPHPLQPIVRPRLKPPQLAGWISKNRHPSSAEFPVAAHAAVLGF